MPHGSGLADELLRIGLNAGLDHVGICDARPFSEARLVLEHRKSEGLSAGMEFTYRNPARSTDPSRSLAGARSLVVGCLGYARDPSNLPAVEPPRRGSVARYSWVDYYARLRSALSEIAACLTARGWKALVLADDNALVDRAAAVRAGLGWYGKNCNVLLPGEGSMFVLGSVVTDASLSEGSVPPAVPDGCGTCRRCLEDCPTGALVAPGVLDARRCLAWLVQAPGVFPVEHREALGDRMYGCDACQDRCPANRVAFRRHPAAAAEAGSQVAVDVIEILRSSDSEIQRAVGRWYIPKRQMGYVRRNALVVLANVGDGLDPDVVAALEEALTADDPIIRAHAVWAARRLGRVDLLDPLGSEADPRVLAELERPEVAARTARPVSLQTSSGDRPV